MTELSRTDRTTVRRKADRGRYDWATITAILDEGLVAHVGFAVDGQPCVIPMAYARIDDALYLHGATGNHMLRTLASGVEVCATVTLLDGLVLSRSAFHHSMNYRSVVVFGRAVRVDGEEQMRALLAVVDHMVPGRSTDSRPPTPSELRKTFVVRLALTEASAKVRTGAPIEDPADLDLEWWGGELPLRTAASPAVPDADARGPVPAAVAAWTPTRSR
jgi:nitroimidazol reductase NimA-like FMN-containing flavoprotein (pyridoxamine 5'-phosphate oxidase superfamily)